MKVGDNFWKVYDVERRKLGAKLNALNIEFDELTSARKREKKLSEIETLDSKISMNRSSADKIRKSLSAMMNLGCAMLDQENKIRIKRITRERLLLLSLVNSLNATSLTEGERELVASLLARAYDYGQMCTATLFREQGRIT